MSSVLVRKSGYEYDTLRANVFEMLERVDPGSIKPGSRVLIKPNLLSAARPEQAITTHPTIVRAAAEYALEKGARVQVSDSSAVGSFKRITALCGLDEALKGLNVALSPLKESVTVKSQGRYAELEVSREALEADVVINLPKLKSHVQMGLTLAVKNIFGCIVGHRKPQWHFRAGDDKEIFAEVLASIYLAVKPSINLLDGVLCLEGQGPGAKGIPRQIGVLMASDNAIAIDMAVCRMLGLAEDGLMTTRALRSLGHTATVELDGELPIVRGFDIPETSDILMGPAFSRHFIRRHISSRPTNIPDICKFCDECVKICPAKAIENISKKLIFDYDRCIRCYCCVEVCPHKAMTKFDTLPGRILKATLRRYLSR